METETTTVEKPDISKMTGVLFRVHVEEKTGAVSSSDWVNTESFDEVKKILELFKKKTEYLGYHMMHCDEEPRSILSMWSEKSQRGTAGLFKSTGRLIMQMYSYKDESNIDDEKYSISVKVYSLFKHDSEWVSKFMKTWDIRPTVSRMEEMQIILDDDSTDFKLAKFIGKLADIMMDDRTIDFSYKDKKYSAKLNRRYGYKLRAEIFVAEYTSETGHKKPERLYEMMNSDWFNDVTRRAFCQAIFDRIDVIPD